MFRLPRNRRTTLIGCILIAILLLLLLKSKQLWIFCPSSKLEAATMTRENKVLVGPDQKTFVYNRESPLVFIGGVPRSGKIY